MMLRKRIRWRWKGKTGERYILGGEDANLLEFMDILQI